MAARTPGQQAGRGAGTAGKHPPGAGAGADGAAHRRRRRAGPSGSARERDAQHPEEERSRRPPPRLHDAGVQPRIEYPGLQVDQCRRHRFRHRAESADRANARADPEH